MRAHYEMQGFHDGLDLSGEGDRGVRGGFQVSNLCKWMLLTERGNNEKD